jgi:hypothetical protein
MSRLLALAPLLLGLLPACSPGLPGPGGGGSSDDDDSTTEDGPILYDDLPEGTDAYATGGPAWDHLDMTWCLSAAADSLEPGEVVQATEAALDEWARVAPLSFTLTSCDEADIEMLFAAGDHCGGGDFDGSSGVLAHAWHPADGGDVHFDDDETWTADFRDGGGQPIDLQTVALHELGHSLGLDHSGTTSAVMFFQYTGSRRTLDPDDILGIQALYGSDDADGDGWSDDLDCDDGDPDVHPEAAEVCNGVDDDCDEDVPADEADDDGDGSRVCDGDCDDGDAQVLPGAGEACDELDNDCDGTVDEGYVDSNGDGVLDCMEVDGDGDGWLPAEGDCDDDDGSVHPGAAELCNGHDDDCDGQVPSGEADGDGDGVRVCGGDCDDSDDEVAPGLPEVCFDETDQDCSGVPDGGCGTFVDAAWIRLGPNYGSYTTYVDYPSNATNVVPLLAVHTAMEHPDDQCEWTTSTQVLTGMVRFDLDLEHCGVTNGAPWAFEAQAVVFARVGGSGGAAYFDLDTTPSLPSNHTLTGSTSYSSGGASSTVAVCSMLTADGQGDVDMAWACEANRSGSTLSGSAYENYGNSNSYVQTRIAALGLASNANASLQAFDCNSGSTVTVGHGTSTAGGQDHLAFVFPTDWETGTNDHFSLESDCGWSGGLSECEISCWGSGQSIGGKVLFLDGALGWR